jgi:protein SCO1/2
VAERTTTPAGNLGVLDHTTPGEVIAAFIDRVKEEGSAAGATALLPFLSERHPVYRERSTGEAVRIRGYAMAALEHAGPPDRALPYLLESLESEFHPYLVAAAARALRGIRQPHPAIAAYLVKAVYNIWKADQPVSFGSYQVEWPQKEFSTGLVEIFGTLAGFGASARQALPELERLHASHPGEFSGMARSALAGAIAAIRSDDREAPAECCALPQWIEQAGEPRDATTPGRVPGDLVIQDQDGLRVSWGDFFCQKPSVLAFFYTRCGNPRKCTQTIFNLSHIRDELERAGCSAKVRVAAITYDPRFDTPEALKSYGNARKFRFDEDSRMFRVPERFQQVVQAFGLGVNYTGTQVNSHRIEFYLLDETGAVVRSFLRIQTDPEQVVEAVRSLLSAAPAAPAEAPGPELCPRQPASRQGMTSHRFHSASSIVLGVLLAFFPKCPVCWVSYLSALGVAGAGSIPYSPWLLPVIVVLLAVNLYFLHWRAAHRNGYAPFLVSLPGSILMFLSIPQFGLPRWLMIPGLALLLGGSLLQALSYPAMNKLRWMIAELRSRLDRKGISAAKR